MLFIFDMGGVLVHTEEIASPIMRVLNISEQQFLDYNTNEKNQNMMDLMSDGRITSQEYWKEFSKKYGKEINTDYWRILLHPRRDDEMYEIVAELKKKHRVVCGTNTIHSHYDCHLCRNDYSIFDDVYASQVMGVSKPDVRFWQTILECENVKPQDAFFTDDRLDNCKAAESLGIQTVHFTNTSEFRKAIKKYL